MAEGRDRSIVGNGRETPQTPPRDVLQEHALDWILGAKREDLVELRLQQC